MPATSPLTRHVVRIVNPGCRLYLGLVPFLLQLLELAARLLMPVCTPWSSGLEPREAKGFYISGAGVGCPSRVRSWDVYVVSLAGY